MARRRRRSWTRTNAAAASAKGANAARSCSVEAANAHPPFFSAGVAAGGAATEVGVAVGFALDVAVAVVEGALDVAVAVVGGALDVALAVGFVFAGGVGFVSASLPSLTVRTSPLSPTVKW